MIVTGIKAMPDRYSYSPGQVMNIWVKVDYKEPPIRCYAVVSGMGMQWRTLPLYDYQVPLLFTIPIQIPYCTIVSGETITEYPIKCPSSMVPKKGAVKFDVSLYDMGNHKLASTSFVVNIKGTTKALEIPEEEKGVPWWLIAAGAVLLFG